MKTRSKILGLAAAALALTTSSCMTTYDAYGNPVQSVDPGVAVAGAVAAGVIGHAIADDDDNHYYYRGGRRYYRNPYYRHRRGRW